MADRARPHSPEAVSGNAPSRQAPTPECHSALSLALRNSYCLYSRTPSVSPKAGGIWSWRCSHVATRKLKGGDALQPFCVIGLADPPAALRGGAGGEPAGNVQSVHNRRDVATHRGCADPGAAGDRVVMQAFGHQFQDCVLGRVTRPSCCVPRWGASGVARSHSISKYSRNAAMITGARISSAPAVPAGVSGSIAVV